MSYKLTILLLIFFLLIFLFLKPYNVANKTQKITLWSWQRTEDLSFVVPSKTSVAPLILTIYIDRGKFKVVPRNNSFIVPTATMLIPVFRLEIQDNKLLDNKNLTILNDIILSASEPGQLIQLDFDATYSQRELYKQIITSLTKNNREVSITALSSWCVFDGWIEELPIKYAVPMLYKGRGKELEFQEIKEFLIKNKNWSVKKCQGYIGLMVDDIFTFPDNFNIFLFNKNMWDSETYDKIKDNV